MVVTKTKPVLASLTKTERTGGPSWPVITRSVPLRLGAGGCAAGVKLSG